MKFLRREKRIERGNLGPGESYQVEVMVDVYWNPHTRKEEDVYDGEAMATIEAAVEAVHPGWFHTCLKLGSQKCKACQEKQQQNHQEDLDFVDRRLWPFPGE